MLQRDSSTYRHCKYTFHDVLSTGPDNHFFGIALCSLHLFLLWYNEGEVLVVQGAAVSMT